MEVVKIHEPAVLLPGKQPRYAFITSQAVAQNRSARDGKQMIPTRVWSWTKVLLPHSPSLLSEQTDLGL